MLEAQSIMPRGGDGASLPLGSRAFLPTSTLLYALALQHADRNLPETIIPFDSYELCVGRRYSRWQVDGGDSFSLAGSVYVPAENLPSSALNAAQLKAHQYHELIDSLLSQNIPSGNLEMRTTYKGEKRDGNGVRRMISAIELLEPYPIQIGIFSYSFLTLPRYGDQVDAMVDTVSEVSIDSIPTPEMGGAEMAALFSEAGLLLQPAAMCLAHLYFPLTGMFSKEAGN